MTLNGFTFNGSHIASGQPAGIDLRFLNNVFNLQAMATGNSMILSNPQRLTLTNNKFTTTGSNLNGSAVIQVEGNYAGTGTANFMDVTGNTFLGVPDANNRRTLQLTFNNVQGNVQDNVFDGVDIGVLVAGTSGNLTISGNTFQNITRGAAQIAAGSFGAGVVFYNPTLSGPVTLSNNTFQNSDAGFRTSTDGSGTFTLNSPTVGITGNTFTGNVFNIVDKFAGTLTLDGNNVFDGVTLSSATTAQLFAIEDKIVDAIDVSGFGLVRLKANNIFVTANSFFAPSGTTTPSIQRGIAAATAGDTVNVAAGTYLESVTVNKSVTVLGAQAGLNPAGRTNPALESIVSAPSGTNGFSIGASNVTVRGFTVTTAGGGVYGVAETTPVTGTVIDRNIVSGFGGLGIALAAGSSGAAVTENDVSNNYAGIYLSTGASNVTVRANVVHDNTGTGSDAGSGIVFEGNNTNVLVSQNFIRDNAGSGIYVWDGYGNDFSGTKITSNSITGNDGAGFNNTKPTPRSLTPPATGGAPAPPPAWPPRSAATSTSCRSWSPARTPTCSRPASRATFAPVAGDDSYSLVEEDSYTQGNVLANDSLPSGTPASGLSVQLVQGPQQRRFLHPQCGRQLHLRAAANYHGADIVHLPRHRQRRNLQRRDGHADHQRRQ